MCTGWLLAAASGTLTARLRLHVACIAFIAAALAHALSWSSAHAAPKVIEESVKLRPPGADLSFIAADLALDGNRLVVASTGPFSFPNQVRFLDLFERDASGRWSYVRRLLEVSGEAHAIAAHVALKGNVAAMVFKNTVHIAELINGVWMHTSVGRDPRLGALGSDVAVDGGVIVVGARSANYEGFVIEKGADGSWRHTTTLTARPVPANSGDESGGDVDVSGNTIAVGSPTFTPPSGPAGGSIFLFTRTAPGVWVQSAEVREPTPNDARTLFGRTFALRGDSLAVEGFAGENLQLFRRISGAWTRTATVQRVDTVTGWVASPLGMSNEFLVHSLGDDDRSPAGSALVYRIEGSNLRAIAELHASERVSHTLDLPSVSGRTIATRGLGFVLLHELPLDLTQPAIVQDDFQDGNANGWTPFPVTSWAVVTSGTTRVYRQSNLTGSNIRSILGSANWTNQGIQADVRPTAFAGADRWFGLVARFQDPANYYYISVRNTNQVLLRKKVGDIFTDLAQATLSVPVNRMYRLRLEAVGTRIRGYVDDRLLVEAVDNSLRAGRAGLITFGARADFDNVLVGPNPLVAIFRDTFTFHSPGSNVWRKTSGTWIDPPEDPPPEPDEGPDPFPNQRVFTQTDTSGTARANAGVSTDDQIVQAKATPTTLGSGGWFGVMARHVDDGNFYYLRVAAGGGVSLRKYVNGAFFELARAPLTVTPGATYVLRLHVVGTSLRGYVNGQFLLQAQDASLRSGKYGLATFRTAARFDDVEVWQP